MIEKIYIPTLGRVDAQITYDGLSQKYKDIVTLVVTKSERPLHKRDCNYLVTEDNVGIANTRRQIMYDAGKINFAMIDDDATFFYRDRNYKEKNLPSKESFTDKHFDDMFDTFDEWLSSGYIHCGCRLSDTFPFLDSDYDDNNRISDAHFINGNILSTFIDDIDLTREYVEDFHFIFQYLSRGYKNRLSGRYTIKPLRYQGGGCQLSGRTVGMEKKIFKKLQSEYPEYIRLKESKMNIGSYSFVIKWKKMYKDGVIKRQADKNLNKFI